MEWDARSILLAFVLACLGAGGLFLRAATQRTATGPLQYAQGMVTHAECIRSARGRSGLAFRLTGPPVALEYDGIYGDLADVCDALRPGKYVQVTYLCPDTFRLRGLSIEGNVVLTPEQSLAAIQHNGRMAQFMAIGALVTLAVMVLRRLRPRS